MQAHTLGEVGNLGTVSLRVCSGTILPIFIDIGSYLTEKEQKNKLAQFFLRYGVDIMAEKFNAATVSNWFDYGIRRKMKFTDDVCRYALVPDDVAVHGELAPATLPHTAKSDIVLVNFVITQHLLKITCFDDPPPPPPPPPTAFWTHWVYYLIGIVVGKEDPVSVEVEDVSYHSYYKMLLITSVTCFQLALTGILVNIVTKSSSKVERSTLTILVN